MSIARTECLNSHGRNAPTNKKKIYHNCKAKGGKEKGLKENACQCWQQRVCVLEDKQTKNIAGNKKTGNRRLAQSYRGDCSCFLSPKS